MPDEIGISTMKVRVSRSPDHGQSLNERVVDLPLKEVEVHLDSEWGEWFIYKVEEALQTLDPQGAIIGYWRVEKYSSDRRIRILAKPLGLTVDSATLDGEYLDPGIAWMVSKEGRLSASDTRLPAEYFWDTGGLFRAMQGGYSSVDWFDLIVIENEGGYGGGPAIFDLISFLWNHGIDLGFWATVSSWPLSRLYKLLTALRRSRQMDTRARAIIRAWDRAGINDPLTLRQWFDSKETWKVDQIARRLDVSEAIATDLLRGLGYERIHGRSDWRIGAGRRARRKRNKWLRSETDSFL